MLTISIMRVILKGLEEEKNELMECVEDAIKNKDRVIDIQYNIKFLTDQVEKTIKDSEKFLKQLEDIVK